MIHFLELYKKNYFLTSKWINYKHNDLDPFEYLALVKDSTYFEVASVFK